MEDWSVDEWLKKAGMGKYVQAFLDNGYDTPELCGGLKDEDLDAIGVTSKQHRSKLFAQAKLLLDLKSTTSQANGSCNNNNALLSTSPSHPPPTYSEPWTGRGVGHNGVVAHGTDATDSHNAINRKPSGDKPPAKPKRQTHTPKRQTHGPVSPSLPPAPYPRGEGAPMLTKLQLKLKIREELQKDGIFLSEPPYCQKDNQLGESELMDLAENYSQRFRVDSLGVYDALFKLWQHSTSEFVPTIKEPSTTQGAAMMEPSSNYDEPFDTQNEQSGKPLARVSSHEVPTQMLGKLQLSPKSRTLPPAGSQSKTYDEPFDTMSIPTQPSPKHLKPRSPKHPSKQEATSPPPVPVKQPASPGSSPDEGSKHRHSAEAGSQKSPKLSPHSSPKLSRFKLFRKKTHRPEGKKSSRKKDEKKYGSADDLTEMGVSVPYDQSSRKSVPIITLGEKPGTPPLPGAGDSTTSESDDSPYPQKKHFGAKHAHSSPAHHIKQKDDEVSSGENCSEQNGGLPTPQMRKMVTSSDLELHKIHPDAEAQKQSLRLSQSHEELRNAGVTFADPPDKEEKQAKKQGLISRIFKRRSMTPILRRKVKDKGNRDSTVSESALMVSSKSMPEIALAGVLQRSANSLGNEKDTPTFTDTGYPDVFDAIRPSGQGFRPPKPARQRKLQPSPLLSPDEPLPVQKKMVIKSVPSMSPTDLVVIPIHSGSAPEETSCLINEPLSSGGHSPEFDELKFTEPVDTKSEKSVSFKESPHIAWGPKSICSQTESKSPVPRTDSHSHSPTQLQGDNEQEPSPTSEIGLLRSSSGSSTGSIPRKPAPPPKPRELSTKGRPVPSQTDAKKLFKSHSEGEERGTEISSLDATASKTAPPPKPSRSKYRTLRIEAVKNSQAESENRSKTLGNRSLTNQDFDPVSLPMRPPRLFERWESEGSIRTTDGTNGRLGTTASLPESLEGSRKPKPLPKPRLLAQVSPVRTEDDTAAPLLLETQLCDKLSNENIDLTQIPYSSMWGDYGIPTPLISRYASELGHTPTEIAHTLDKIRGKKLKELSREYAAVKKSDLQQQTKIDRDSIDDFLTSIGLPMYSQVFRERGYVAVQQISELGDAGLDEFGLKSEHSKFLAQYLPKY